MGSLVSVVPLLGLFAGFLISLFTKEELRDGKNYFSLLQNLLLAIVFVVLLWSNIAVAVALGVILFSLMTMFNFEHKVLVVPLLGVLVALYPLVVIPVFLYFISFASCYIDRKELIYYGLVYLVIVAV